MRAYSSGPFPNKGDARKVVSAFIKTGIGARRKRWDEHYSAVLFFNHARGIIERGEPWVYDLPPPKSIKEVLRNVYPECFDPVEFMDWCAQAYGLVCFYCGTVFKSRYYFNAITLRGFPVDYDKPACDKCKRSADVYLRHLAGTVLYSRSASDQSKEHAAEIAAASWLNRQLKKSLRRNK